MVNIKFSSNRNVFGFTHRPGDIQTVKETIPHTPLVSMYKRFA